MLISTLVFGCLPQRNTESESLPEKRRRVEPADDDDDDADNTSGDESGEDEEKGDDEASDFSCSLNLQFIRTLTIFGTRQWWKIFLCR